MPGTQEALNKGLLTPLDSSSLQFGQMLVFLETMMMAVCMKIHINWFDDIFMNWIETF